MQIGSNENTNISIGWVNHSNPNKRYGFITRFSDGQVFFFHYCDVDKSLFRESKYFMESERFVTVKENGRYYGKRIDANFTETKYEHRIIEEGTIVLFKSKSSNKARDIAHAIKKPVEYKDLYFPYLKSLWSKEENLVYELTVPSVRYEFNYSAIEEIDNELERYSKLSKCLKKYIESIDFEFLLSQLYLEDEIIKHTKIGDTDDWYLDFVAKLNINISDYYKSHSQENQFLYSFIGEDRFLEHLFYYRETIMEEGTYGNVPRMLRIDKEEIKKEVMKAETIFKDKLRKTYSKEIHLNYFLKSFRSRFENFIYKQINFIIDKRGEEEITGFTIPRNNQKVIFAPDANSHFVLILTHYFHGFFTCSETLKDRDVYKYEVFHISKNYKGDDKIIQHSSYCKFYYDDDDLKLLCSSIEGLCKSAMERFDKNVIL